jgi:PKHD-type hydroxylase
MYLVIADVLSAEEIKEARSVLNAAEFIDGRATAGWHARAVKHNLQAGRGDRAIEGLQSKLAARIEENALFRMFARPRQLIPTGVDQNLWAQSRMPMDMIFQGWSLSLVQASQQ